MTSMSTCMSQPRLRAPRLARLRRALAMAAAATVMSGLAVTAGTTPASADVSVGPDVGVQFHGMWSNYTDAQRAPVLDKMAAAHVQWVRLDVSWSMLQPDGPSSYNTWGVNFVDRVVTMATSRHLKVLVTLWLTPKWANGGAGERGAPEEPQGYARGARGGPARSGAQGP